MRHRPQYKGHYACYCSCALSLALCPRATTRRGTRMTNSNKSVAGQDVVDILIADHREMMELLGQVKHTSDTSRRRDLADTVIAEVMRHAVAEETYVYPA